MTIKKEIEVITEIKFEYKRFLRDGFLTNEKIKELFLKEPIEIVYHYYLKD